MSEEIEELNLVSPTLTKSIECIRNTLMSHNIELADMFVLYDEDGHIGLLKINFTCCLAAINPY